MLSARSDNCGGRTVGCVDSGADGNSRLFRWLDWTYRHGGVGDRVRRRDSGNGLVGCVLRGLGRLRLWVASWFRDIAGGLLGLAGWNRLMGGRLLRFGRDAAGGSASRR
jgi:hypothetical protein